MTGHSATTGEVFLFFFFFLSQKYRKFETFEYCLQTVNIVNAYEDHRFDPSVDDGQTFKHRSILCMAIKNSLGQIIGVIQLVNKFNGLVSVLKFV